VASITLQVVVTSHVDVEELDDVAQALKIEPSIGDAMVGVARLAELALAHARMSLIQYRLLHYLRRGRSIQSDLAFQLAVTKQSVTRLVDGLVEKGYITRRVDQGDRRRVLHAITRKGERALDRADELLERYLMSVLQDLEDDNDIEVARLGLKFFGRAKHASYQRVHPDGIVPGRKSRRGAL
jgi:long-chain acyl-CoA synthetase